MENDLPSSIFIPKMVPVFNRPPLLLISLHFFLNLILAQDESIFHSLGVCHELLFSVFFFFIELWDLVSQHDFLYIWGISVKEMLFPLGAISVD